MKKWQKFLIWFMYGVAIVIATDLFKFFVEKDMLKNSFYILLIELIFFGLGCFAVLESRFKETNKRRKK